MSSRDSIGSAKPHHNYELFSLVKLFGVATTGVPESNNNNQKLKGSFGVTQDEKKDNKVVSIQHVAVGSSVDRTFVAMALSNGTYFVLYNCYMAWGWSLNVFSYLLFFAVHADLIIFRYVGESGVPLFRQMAWTLKDKIISMDFNPTAQWLMIVATDCTVVLVPIYFMMCKGNTEDFEEKTPQNNR